MFVNESDLKSHIEESTPAINNKCKICGGDVIKKIMGINTENKLCFSIPQCKNCGKGYYYAEDVSIVGMDEYIEKLNNVTFHTLTKK